MASLRRAKMDVIHEYCIQALGESMDLLIEADEEMQADASPRNVFRYQLGLANNSALLGLRELTEPKAGGSNEFLLSSSDTYLLLDYDLSKAWL